MDPRVTVLQSVVLADVVLDLVSSGRGRSASTNQISCTSVSMAVAVLYDRVGSVNVEIKSAPILTSTPSVVIRFALLDCDITGIVAPDAYRTGCAIIARWRDPQKLDN
jgi:hypothetical protein